MLIFISGSRSGNVLLFFTVHLSRYHMRSYQLNSNLRLIVQDKADVNDNLKDAYEAFFKELLSTLAISNSGVLEVVNLQKHRISSKQQQVYPYLHKRTIPPFSFLIFKN
jgi:hypothetical protein